MIRGGGAAIAPPDGEVDLAAKRSVASSAGGLAAVPADTPPAR